MQTGRVLKKCDKREPYDGEEMGLEVSQGIKRSDS